MKKCLIVDDVEVTRFVSEEIMEELGIESLIAGDLNSAKEMLKSNNVDIVLLDWHLGKESGLELISYVRKTNQNLPIVMFSGIRDSKKHAEALSAGADDYIEKPTTRDKIRGSFQKLGLIT